MNHEQRKAMIGALLRDVILPRYDQPAHLDDPTARAELADMVEDLVAIWPLMRQEQFPIHGQKVMVALRRSYDGRKWPTIAKILKAAEVANRDFTPVVEGGGQQYGGRFSPERAKRQQIVAWLEGKKACPERWITPERMRAMVESGMLDHRRVGNALQFLDEHRGSGAILDERDEDAHEAVP